MIAITVENTPNINSKKFVPGCLLLESYRVYDFHKNDPLIKRSPLAQRIFMLPCISHIMIARDFLTVTRDSEQVPWFDVEIVVRDVLAQHLRSDEDAVNEKDIPAEGSDGDHEGLTLDFQGPEGEVLNNIADIIATYIQPAVAADGGHVQFRGFKDGVVYLELQGACSSCGSAEITLKNGIENLLKHYIPEVSAVSRVKRTV